MTTLPDDASTATPRGFRNDANVASPPSPLYPYWSVPAMVVMMPVLFVIKRIALLAVSAMYKSPVLVSVSIPCGKNKVEFTASPPSPV